MVLYIGRLKLKIEYSFLLMLSFAILFKTERLVYILLFSALHELGHLTALYLLKGSADVLTVSYYGIGLKHSSKLTKACEIAFLSAGCAVNFVFALLSIHPNINLALFILNILPVYPLDGGRILKLLLGIKNEKLYIGISFSFLILICVFSIINRNVILFMITVYLAVYAYNEELR